MTDRVWISCNGCGADAFREIVTVGDWQIGQCYRCSLFYVNPMPFFGSTGFHDIAENFYYTALQHKIKPTKISIAKKQLSKQLEEIGVAPQGHSRKLLDVGCGPGLGVRAAAEMGWEAVGIDLDPVLVELGKDQLDVDLRCGNLIDAGWSDRQFQFVRLMYVLEHLPNPYDVLVELKRVLTPGGRLLIVVPNEDGFINRAKLLLGGKRKARLGTLVPPHHLHAFCPRTLERILNRAGFEVTLIKTASPTATAYAAIEQLIDWSVKKRLFEIAWRITAGVGKGSALVAHARRAA